MALVSAASSEHSAGLRLEFIVGDSTSCFTLSFPWSDITQLEPKGAVRVKRGREESSPNPGISSSDKERDLGGRRGLINTGEFGRGEDLDRPLAWTARVINVRRRAGKR